MLWWTLISLKINKKLLSITFNFKINLLILLYFPSMLKLPLTLLFSLWLFSLVTVRLSEHWFYFVYIIFILLFWILKFYYFNVCFDRLWSLKINKELLSITFNLKMNLLTFENAYAISSIYIKTSTDIVSLSLISFLVGVCLGKHWLYCVYYIYIIILNFKVYYFNVCFDGLWSPWE